VEELTMGKTTAANAFIPGSGRFLTARPGTELISQLLFYIDLAAFERPDRKKAALKRTAVFLL